MTVYAKTTMNKLPDSCTECKAGKRYGFVGDVFCQVLNEYFTGNVRPPYKERPDECPLIDMNDAIEPKRLRLQEEQADRAGEEALRQAMWKCGQTNNAVTRYTADAIAEKLVREHVEPMRIEITTDDFDDLELAHERGYYRKHYFCPACAIEIGCQTYDSDRMFGQGTVLHSNKFPSYCPNCGAKLNGA